MSKLCYRASNYHRSNASLLHQTKWLTAVLPALILAMALFLYTLPATADPIISGNYTYTVTDEVYKTAQLNRIDGASGDVEIQSVIDGYTITEIQNTINGSIFVSMNYGENNSVASVTIPDSVTSIGDNAFRYSFDLTSVTIPANVASIGNYAFYGCTGLSSATIPDSVTSIGSYAFYNCTNLAGVTIPNSVTGIGGAAFYNCTGLTSVNILAGVTSIGDSTFFNCAGLTSIILPASVTLIGDQAFSYCTNLQAIDVDAGNTSYKSVDGVLLDHSGTTIIQYPVGKTNSTYLIPDGVTSIGDYAFYACQSLTCVDIPDGVTSIGHYAFYNCTSLTSATIPDSVTSIGDYGFYQSTSLTSVTIGSGVAVIGSHAFAYTGLASIILPGSLNSVSDCAFYRCNSLTGAYFYGNAPEFFSNANVFLDVAPGFKIYYFEDKTGWTNPYRGYPAAIAHMVNFDLNGGTHTGGGELFQLVEHGCYGIAPTAERANYNFTCWDKPLNNEITGHTTITAQWELKTYLVTFDLAGGKHTGGGELYQTVEHGASAVAPTTERANYIFKGWDKALDNITKATTISAQWEPMLQSIAITRHPKLIYAVGDELDITGLEVTGTYSDWSSRVLTVTKDNIAGFDSSAPAAIQVLTVSVAGKTTSYIIAIIYTTPPSLVGSSPADGANDAAISSNVIFNFSEAIAEGSAYSGITFKNAWDNDVPFTAGIDGKTLTLDPAADLNYSSSYTVRLPADSVQGMTGNGLDHEYTLTFITAVDPAAAPSWPNGSLTASDVDQTGLILTWSGATDDVGVTGYKVYQGANLLTGTPVTGISYPVAGLSAGTQYSFRVEAGDAAGNWSTDGPSVSVVTAVYRSSETVQLSLPNTTGKPGQTLTIPLTIAEGEGTAAFQFSLYFDPESLSDLQLSKGSLIAGDNRWTVISSVYEHNQLCVVGYNGQSLGLAGGGGELLNLACTIGYNKLNEDVLSLNFNDLLVSDALGVDMPVSASNGKINIAAGLKGDVSGDGIVNILDLVITLNIGLEKLEPTAAERYAADVNSDGIVNVLDVVKIVNIILHIN